MYITLLKHTQLAFLDEKNKIRLSFISLYYRSRVTFPSPTRLAFTPSHPPPDFSQSQLIIYSLLNPNQTCAHQIQYVFSHKKKVYLSTVLCHHLLLSPPSPSHGCGPSHYVDVCATPPKREC